jgi:hypothetical protein
MKAAGQPELYLAGALERLMALPLDTPAHLVKWDAECFEVEATMNQAFAGFPIWHEAEHYFDDADIRVRDLGYRERQHGLMRDYVSRLRAAAAGTATGERTF